MAPHLPSTARLLRISPSTTLSSSSRALLPSSQRRTYKQAPLPPSVPPIPSPTGYAPQIPSYPLGPRQAYKQSNTGLYGTARIRFGNHVAEGTEVINPKKARRWWRPNVQQKRLWSAALGSWVRTRATTRVLRSVDKAGGLDEYLLGGKPARIAELGPWGWRLRWRVMQTDAVRERFRAERVALGLPAEGLFLTPKEEGETRSSDVLPDEQAPVDSAAAAEGSTEAQLAETQRMIDAEEEFDLAPSEKGFMKEEKSGKAPQ